MSERIDHAAEARRLLEDTAPFRGQHLEVAMTSAQVHATLALVEQQRIANVLYLARESHADILEGIDAIGADPDDIKEALGL